MPFSNVSESVSIEKKGEHKSIQRQRRSLTALLDESNPCRIGYQRAEELLETGLNNMDVF